MLRKRNGRQGVFFCSLTFHMHLVHDTELIVKGTTQDDKIILAPLELHSRFYILCYDLHSNDLIKVET